MLDEKAFGEERLTNCGVLVVITVVVNNHDTNGTERSS